MKRRIAIPFGMMALLALLVAACSQSARNGFTPATGPMLSRGADPGTAYADLSGRALAKGVAYMTIVVPPHPVSSAHPMDVSPGAQSADVEVTGGGATPQNVLFPLNAKQSYCKGGTSTVALRCSITISVPAAKDTFLVNVLATDQKTGPVLDTGRTVQTIVANKRNTVTVATFGFIRYLQIALGNPHPSANGNSISIPVYLTAADAWGYTIVGGYNKSIKLADNDTTGNTSLSATTLTTSTQAGAVTLSYNGKHMPQVLIGAQAGSLTATAAFAPGTGGIVPVPALVHVAFTTTGVPLNLGGPGTVGPFSVATSADPEGDPPCAKFADVSGTGKKFLITAAGNLGTCWLSVRDRAGHFATIPVLVSAFPYASSAPSGAPSPTPTPVPTKTPSPPPPPSPTPTPGIDPVIVTPNLLTICPRAGPNFCTPYAATVNVTQPGTPGNFIEGDNCSSLASVVASNPGGQIVRYRVTALGSLSGSCRATFTGFGAKTTTLLIQVQASGIIIDTKPTADHHHL